MSKHEKMTSKLASYCQLCQMVTSAIRDGEKTDGAYITEKSTEAAKIAESILDEFKLLRELAEVAKAYYERKKADWIRAVTKEYDAEYAEKNFTPGEIGMFNLAASLKKIGMLK